MKLDAVLRGGWVVEIWHDELATGGERFVAVVSRGKEPRGWRGCGKTVEKAVADALDVAGGELDTNVELVDGTSPEPT